jgi:hypothetical protein
VKVKIVANIENDCSEQGDLTELITILNSVHTSNDSLHRRRVTLSVVTSIQSDCREHDDISEMTPILINVHTSNDS